MSETGDKRSEAAGASAEEAPAFRVVDRRRFAADGSERHDAGSDEAAGGGGSGVGAAASEPAGGRGAEGARNESAFVMRDSPRTGSEPPPEPSLSTLLLSLSTQALMHLGEIPDLATGKPTRDLAAARSIIDLLAVLERKTKGNLDSAEASLLDRVLFDLRMRFVEISRS